MTRSELDERLNELLTDIGLAKTTLTDDSHFSRDLGLDSLDITDLMLQIEMYFNIRIPDEDWWKLETVGKLKAYLVSELFFNGSYWSA